MGHPWFQLKDLAKQHNIIALSSQYTLYGSMSNRVLDIMRTFCKSVEPYSIDENFLSWEGMEGHWPTASAMGRAIGETVLRYTGIPTCTGIAQTKTLAKLANFIAKKRPEFGGVCDLSAFSDNDLSAMLQSIPVGEIWGVGRRLDAHLAQLGVNTVDDLRRASSSWLRAHFGVVMERTGTELRGIPCLDLEEIAPAKKQIVSSKSFGQMVFRLDELRESIAAYTTRAAEKLRSQLCSTSAVQVFIQTNSHRQDQKQYSNAITIPLSRPTSDTRVIIKAALFGLEQIYRPGYFYKKSGVIFSGIFPAQHLQSELFCSPLQQQKLERNTKMMDTLDELNRRFGRDTLKIAATGLNQQWQIRPQLLTDAFTTRWGELPKAFAQN